MLIKYRYLIMKNIIKATYTLSVVCAITFLFSACNRNMKAKKEITTSSDTAYVDQKYTNFFARDCCGMTGADGVYSVPLPDGRNVWIFGDTFLGTVNPDGSREKSSPLFIRNSFAIQDNDSLRTLYQNIDGWESSFVIPPNAVKGTTFSEDSLWYWPGDGFIENGKLKVFMSAFYQKELGNWGFRWISANIVTFSLPDIKIEKIEKLDYTNDVDIHWGHAVCDDDNDYTYIYGGGDKYPYVARAPKGDINMPWEFYTGTEWVKDSRLAKPMIDFQGSEQFSVFKLKDKYILMTSSGQFPEENVCTFTSNNPFSGWANMKEHYKIKPIKPKKDLFAYNPVAHPEHIENNELLVSYCVNSFSLDEVFQNASSYRPIFIRIPIDLILKTNDN